MTRSQEMVERLTKLAASKDVAAFHALQVSGDETGIPMPVPMDDASLASRMMGIYDERGIDPSLALSPDSDPLEEFGGRDVLFGKDN